MKKVKAIAYIRVGTDSQRNGDRQREELLAKFGGTHEIVAEYQDTGPGNQDVRDRPGLKLLLDDAAKGKFDVLLCTDLPRLARLFSPEIITALRDAGVKVVTADRGELGFADLVTHTVMNQSAKMYSVWMSERIKQGIRAARERRKDADAGSGSE